SLGGVYGAYVRRSLNITLLRTAVLLIPAAAAAGLALLVASRFSRPERRMLELAALFVVSAGGALGLAVAPTAYAAAGAGPIIAAAMIEQSGGPSDRGLVIGTLMSIEGLGAVVGPGVTAAVISASGARASLAFIGAVFVLLVPLSYAAWRSSRIAASPDPAQASI